MSRNNNSKQKTPLVTHLVAGGAAGLMEACTCHPLDTIKVRMQLSKSGSRSATVSLVLYIVYIDQLIVIIGSTSWFLGSWCKDCKK